MSQYPLPKVDGLPLEPIRYFEPDPPSGPLKYRLALLFFLLTVATTTGAGVVWHAGFTRMTELSWGDWVNGVPYSFWVLAILVAHEMGHYLCCRYYRIDATLPYLIPFAPILFGTMGAVIRIKSLFLNRKQLFDVGVAGPLAGFVVLVPALALGIHWSNEYDFSSQEGALLVFGEPLLFRVLEGYLFSGEGTASLNLHPIGWAAWFGMLATSMNLLPMGQLDGGHMVYALFGPRVHKWVSYSTMVALVALGVAYKTPGYIPFAILVRILGFGHPRPVSERPLRDPRRIFLALLGVLVFVLTFVPLPFRFLD